MTKIYRLCVVLLLISAVAHGESLSLKQAVEKARLQNSRILQYKSRVEQKEAEKQTAFGNYLPSLTLDGAYNHLNDNINLDFNPIRDAMVGLQVKNSIGFADIASLMSTGQHLTPEQQAAVSQQTLSALDKAMPSSQFVSRVKDQDNFALSLTAVQPLFTGFKISAGYQAAAKKLELAQTEFQQTENGVIRETADNYLNAVILKRILKIRQSVLNGMQQHRSNAEKLLLAGLIDRSSYLRAEVAVSDAERNLSDDQNRLNLALIALKSSMGGSQTDDISVADTLTLVEMNQTLDQQLSIAKANQPVFKTLEQNRSLLQVKKKADQSDYYPTLAAFGKYEVYQDDLSLLEPEWVVGLKLSYNIFSGMKDYREIETTQIQMREIDYLQKDTENKIDLYVRKARTDVDNSRERYKKLASAVELASENLKLNQVKFDTGMGTSLDVIDAQLQLEKVLIEKYTTLYNYYLAVNELNYAQGQPLQIFDLWQKSN